MIATATPLDEQSLLQATAWLGARDLALHQIVAAYGPPPLWARAEGFPTLIHIILEQQVSLASAKAAFDRLLVATQGLTPETFLTLTDAELKAIGFSRQKTRYGRYLAEAIAQGTLDLNHLKTLDDTDAKAYLMQIKGIGLWTAEIYLLMALKRPDIWPAGDLALAIAAQKLYKIETRPSAQELIDLSFKWQPYRAVAARILWHFYLSHRRPNTPNATVS